MKPGTFLFLFLFVSSCILSAGNRHGNSSAPDIVLTPGTTEFLFAMVTGPVAGDTNPPRDRLRKRKPIVTPSKGFLSFKISIPEGNHLYLNKGAKWGSSFGFLGISGGLKYYFSDKYCLNTDIGILTDFMLPFPAPVDYAGVYERAFATYADLQVGTDYKRLHYDIGIQFTRTQFQERETAELFPRYNDTLRYSVKQNNAGLALSVYYRVSRSFNVGVNYYPSVFAWGDQGLNVHYSHLVFFELSFDIRTPKR